MSMEILILIKEFCFLKLFLLLKYLVEFSSENNLEFVISFGGLKLW